ncbi:MAG TPA: ABC transporter ATP-binding protein [Candidatus Coproplasma excrementigallinarum]|uniref:ABC transporter ATP-binding protein n=1 Tax=Candidatus Coproplasma excrementigallinarum TaxID=2840747 RepID=A0A9D1MK32_9FIRM|nr:ABC transporter ATP-binding protein [Candidatus Coproplasma excrementigallinarum]
MVKEIAHSLREYKKQSVATPVLVMFEVFFECLIPFVIALLVDKIQENCDLNEILAYGGVLVVMAGLSLVFGVSSGAMCAAASSGLAKNLRRDMFYKIQSYSFENIDKFNVSSLITRMTTDVTNVQNAYMLIIRLVIRSPLMLIFSFVMAFVMGGSLAWVFVFVVPLLAVGLVIIVSKTIPLFRRAFRKYDRLNNSIQENVRAAREVKSYVREDYEQKKFGAAAHDLRSDFQKAERILAFNQPIMQFCLYVVMCVVLSFGSYLVITTYGEDWSIGVGELSSILTYGFMMLNNLMMLSMAFTMIAMAGESGRRIVEVLKEESSLENPAEPVYDVKDGSIDFDNVSFKYSAAAERWALSGIDLHIKSGETIGIIGGTGSSKSTLVQLISRLYDVTEGTVKVGGIDVKQYDLETLRNSVAMVLQKNVLFSGTISENLRWGNANATDDEIKEACHMACADEFIERFPDKYNTYIEQGGANVSGGQKQRLCIARALLKKPKVLILDDSTSAVDTHTDAKIRKALKDYIPATTKIIIAQRTASVEDADRIIVMDGGRIDDIGSHAELIKRNAIYREVYTSQNKEGHDLAD